MIHYYDKIKVAVVELSADVAVGDKLKFVRGGEDLFDQTVSQMQMEHNKITLGKKGDTVAIKMDKEVKEGAEIFKG
ncbi:MAG: hypothetical protein ACD_52C00126G0004 [uncultured bacterium]|nr:MAG: hypothetical protein ACD_52C00126G0004 [uncultured bacterium]